MSWLRSTGIDRYSQIAECAAIVAATLSRISRRPAVSSRSRQAAALAAGVGVAALVWAPQAVSAGDMVPTRLEAYRLGVFPYLPVLRIDRIFGPVAAQFAEDLGRPVMLKTKPSFEKFAEELSKETYDIILVHPFFYVAARDQHHYLPLARLKEPLTALVMVRKDSPAERLADLEGKTMGLPPALSAVSELVKAALIDDGLMPDSEVSLQHYRSKLSCLQAVAIGLVEACGMPRFAIEQIDPDNELELRPLFETPGVSNFIFAAHARVPETDRVNICKSILAWPYTATGRAILAGGAWSQFVPARDSDYAEVRRYASQLRNFAQQ